MGVVVQKPRTTIAVAMETGRKQTPSRASHFAQRAREKERNRDIELQWYGDIYMSCVSHQHSHDSGVKVQKGCEAFGVKVTDIHIVGRSARVMQVSKPLAKMALEENLEVTQVKVKVIQLSPGPRPPPAGNVPDLKKKTTSHAHRVLRSQMGIIETLKTTHTHTIVHHLHIRRTISVAFVFFKFLALSKRNFLTPVTTGVFHVVLE
jgi:hypothetical protein